MANKYRVINKFIYYASTHDLDMGKDSEGNPRIVRQMGPMDRVEVGTILEDVPAHVLAAFPNRFELVPESAPAGAQSPRVAHTQPEVEATPGQAHRVQTEDQVSTQASPAAEPKSEDAQPEPPTGSARSRR